jgi:hypothetical protein
VLAKVSQAIDRKADKKRLKCRVRDERVTAARRGPAEDAVRGKRGKIWEERSISSRSWHNHFHFHINGKLQLDQITAASRAAPVRQALRAGDSIHGAVMRCHAVIAIA